MKPEALGKRARRTPPRMIRRALFGITLSLALTGNAQASDIVEPTPRALVEVSDIVDVAIAPDSGSVAFRVDTASIERNTYDSVWYIASLQADRRLVRAANAGTPLRDAVGTTIIERPQWSPDSHWLYYRALFGEEIQVWRASRDGSRVERVTDDDANVRSFTLGLDGRSLAYEVGPTRAEIERAETLEYDNGIRIDGTVPVAQGAFRSAYIDGRLATQRYVGDWMDRSALLADRPTKRRVVDLSTLTARDTPASADISAASSTLPAPDARSVKENRGNGRTAFITGSGISSALQVVDENESRGVISCDAALCQGVGITGVEWRPGGDEVVFTARDRARGGAHSLRAWNLASNTVREIAASNGLLNDGDPSGWASTCAVGSRLAVCVSASAGVPPTLVSIDLDSGTRQTLFDPNADLAAQAGTDVEFLAWDDDHGHHFTGYLFTPASASTQSRLPLFITYYACIGYLRGGVGDEWPLAPLAAAGIASLCINQAADTASGAASYEAAESSVRSVIKLLDERALIDPSRVGMGGLSFGSEVVTWIAAKSDLIAAASISSGLLTPTYYWNHALQPGFVDSLRRTWSVGPPDGTSTEWQTMSPVFQIDDIHIPFLMQMPEQEYPDTFEFFARLVLAGTATELYVFPHEPHVKIQPRHKLAVYERNLDWFRFWLQGYVDPNPAKTDQYARWQALETPSNASETAKSGPSEPMAKSGP